MQFDDLLRGRKQSGSRTEYKCGFLRRLKKSSSSWPFSHLVTLQPQTTTCFVTHQHKFVHIYELEGKWHFSCFCCKKNLKSVVCIQDGVLVLHHACWMQERGFSLAFRVKHLLSHVCHILYRSCGTLQLVQTYNDQNWWLLLRLARSLSNVAKSAVVPWSSNYWMTLRYLYNLTLLQPSLQLGENVKKFKG